MISPEIDPIYAKIWRKDNGFIPNDMDDAEEHTLCYESLYFAARYERTEAREALEKLSMLDPGHSCPITLEATALIYFSLREFNAAKEFATKSLSEEPCSLFAYQIMARTAIFEGKFAEALQYYKKILEFDTDSDKTFLNIAETHFLNKEFELALQWSRKAKSSERKNLYLFLLSFSFLKTRLLWMLLIIISMLNLYVFFSLFIVTTIILLYIASRYGYKAGDLLIFRRSLYIQAMHSILFLLVLCPTVAYLVQT